MSRPLFSNSTAQLEQFLEDNRHDRAKLEILYNELKLRSSRPAEALRSRVEQILTPLAAPAVTEQQILAIAGILGAGPTTSRPDGGIIPLTDTPGPNDWDESQRSVIEAAAEARQIIDAGPGTGKTAVACARVAFLINSGVEASNIWLISFTRTAVQELRNRIRALVNQDAAASAVRITTLDSHAWRMVAGFESDGHDLFAGYDGTIGGATRLLENPTEEVAEYLASVEHLIVDEAQDLVGIRADLVGLLIRRINPSAGVSVLCDEAQAIYGFAEADSVNDSSEPLTHRLRAGACGEFARGSLTTVHRTESPGLHSILTGTRSTVLGRQVSGVQKFNRVREEILGHADGRVGMVMEQSLNGRDDTLVLFRRRVEVLMASSYLWTGGVSHRLRMSGLPTCIPPWVAVCLSDHDERSIARSDFIDRYCNRGLGLVAPHLSADSAWKLLLATGGTRQGRVDTHLLRARLARSRPPIDLCSHEVGERGPILGTIHASKGRESGVVHLMLPSVPDELKEDVEEETRVLFVGATRARMTLRTGEGIRITADATQMSKRCFRALRRRGVPRAQVEVGHDGDVNLRRLVAESLFERSEDAVASQAALRRMIGYSSEISAWSVAEDGFTYFLRAGVTMDAPIIGVLEKAFNSDLFEVSRSCGAGGRRVKLPAVIRHIRCIGVRTVAVAPDDPILPKLHRPFCDSGFFLAPVISGFTTIEFHDANRR